MKVHRSFPMNEKPLGESQMTNKRVWTAPVVKVILLNTARNGGSIVQNDGTMSKS
jgi:hypothetical protein